MVDEGKHVKPVKGKPEEKVREEANLCVCDR